MMLRHAHAQRCRAPLRLLALGGLCSLCVVALVSVAAGAALGLLRWLAAARQPTQRTWHLDMLPAGRNALAAWSSLDDGDDGRGSGGHFLRAGRAYDLRVRLELEQLPCRAPGSLPVSVLQLHVLREARIAVGLGAPPTTTTALGGCERAVVLPARAAVLRAVSSAAALPARLLPLLARRLIGFRPGVDGGSEEYEPPNPAHTFHVAPPSCVYRVADEQQLPTTVGVALLSPPHSVCAPRVTRASLTVALRLTPWQRLVAERPLGVAAAVVVAALSVAGAAGSCGCVLLCCCGCPVAGLVLGCGTRAWWPRRRQRLLAALCSLPVSPPRPPEPLRGVASARVGSAGSPSPLALRRGAVGLNGGWPALLAEEAAAACAPSMPCALGGAAEALYGGDADNALRPWQGRRPGGCFESVRGATGLTAAARGGGA